MVGDNASGFDNYIVLNSLRSSKKIIKTSRGIIKLCSKVDSIAEKEIEIPIYMKFVCSKCDISGSLRNIQKEYKIQPDFLKGEIVHS